MDNGQQNLPTRAGEKFRSNPERFFHIMTEGWFVFTREGIQGPFIDMPRAKDYLDTYLKDLQANDDPSSSWRL